LKPIQVPDAGLWQRKISVLQIQQPVAVHHVAVHDESGNAARVPDVLRGIGIDDENVGAAAGGTFQGSSCPRPAGREPSPFPSPDQLTICVISKGLFSRFLIRSIPQLQLL